MVLLIRGVCFLWTNFLVPPFYIILVSKLTNTENYNFILVSVFNNLGPKIN
jgi:hypothetical protein